MSFEVEFEKPIEFDGMPNFPIVKFIEFNEPKRSKHIAKLTTFFTKSQRVLIKSIENIPERPESELGKKPPTQKERAKSALMQFALGLDGSDMEIVYDTFDKILCSTELSFNGEYNDTFRPAMLDNMLQKDYELMLGLYVENFIVGLDS